MRSCTVCCRLYPIRPAVALLDIARRNAFSHCATGANPKTGKKTGLSTRPRTDGATRDRRRAHSPLRTRTQRAAVRSPRCATRNLYYAAPARRITSRDAAAFHRPPTCHVKKPLLRAHCHLLPYPPLCKEAITKLLEMGIHPPPLLLALYTPRRLHALSCCPASVSAFTALYAPIYASEIVVRMPNSRRGQFFSTALGAALPST